MIHNFFFPQSMDNSLKGRWLYYWIWLRMPKHRQFTVFGKKCQGKHHFNGCFDKVKDFIMIKFQKKWSIERTPTNIMKPICNDTTPNIVRHGKKKHQCFIFTELRNEFYFFTKLYPFVFSTALLSPSLSNIARNKKETKRKANS